MKRSEIIAELEAECMQRFEEIAQALRLRYPQFRIKAGSGPVGGNTQFQGHHVYIDCDREASEDPEPNCVALEVCVRNLDIDPTLCTLHVTWGGDGVAPSDTADHLAENVRWSDGAVDLIRSTLPKLAVELHSCLQAWEDTYPITGNG